MWLIVGLVAVVIVALGAVGWFLTRDGDSTPEAQSDAAVPTDSVADAPGDGGSPTTQAAVQTDDTAGIDAAAAFGIVSFESGRIGSISGQDFEGRTVQLADGAPTLALLVAHWCGSCAEQIDDLARVAATLDARAVVVMTFTDPDADGFPPDQWLDQAGWNGPTIVDDADWSIGNAVGGVGVPQWLAISADGEVVGQRDGDLTAGEVQALARAAATVPQTASTTTAAPVTVVTLPASAVVASSSSTLPDSDGAYAAANMLDGTLERAWNHCGTGCSATGSARQGVGVTLTFSLDGAYEVVGFRIANGYQKISDSVGDVWPKNNRLETIGVTVGSSTQTVVLDDAKGFQEVMLDSATGTVVVIEVLSVYEGDGTYNDLAVSEIEFLVVDG